MAQNSGTSTIIGALVLGASIVGAALLIQASLTQTNTEIASLRGAVSELELAAPAAPTRQAARPGRPDPSKRYTLDVKDSPAFGPKDAQVTLVEFSDFQCPFCSRVTPTLDKIKEAYGDKVRVVFKHLPLSIHAKAPAAHAAAEAAHRQGKFWEMHDQIFANQREMSPEKYREFAATMGLDVDQFDKDRASSDLKKKVDADAKQAAKLGVTGTPAFFINGRYLSGAQPFEAFKRIIDEEIAKG
jgi:protein-disulfide isomerase